MLSVEDWAELRRLQRSEGMPIKAIARVMGISKNTVKAALRGDEPAALEAGAARFAGGGGGAAGCSAKPSPVRGKG